MTYSFEGKVGIVTGAGSGMGLATAQALAKSGAAVVLADNNAESVKVAARELSESGFKALNICCDVRDEIQVTQMIEKTVETFGRLDIAFNNAGVNSPATDTADLEICEYDRIMGVDLRGIWLCMKYELRQMRIQKKGSIVNCSSLAGLVGNAGRAAYSAAKHGVIGLTKSVALEYADRGVRVNAICPGTIQTGMVDYMVATGDLSLDAAIQSTPMKRVGQPAEIADVVLWLCSDASSFVTGQAVSVDGGYTIQ